MFERFKKNHGNGDRTGDRRTVATTDRPMETGGGEMARDVDTAREMDMTRETDTDTGVHDDRFGRDEDTDVEGGRFAHDADRDFGRGRFARGAATGVMSREAVRDVRARQREEYGGINWGAAFFGFLVAVGMAAILLGILSAAGAAFGLTDMSQREANSNADTIGLVGGILLVAVVAISYWFAGYVSGRMSRFDGARQGIGAWAIGVVVAIALGIAGWLIDPDWNVFDKLGLPNVPIDQGTVTTGGAITLAAVLVLSLLAAMGGGKVGERYHWKIDRLGVAD
jgi:amino acid transporter